MGEYRVTATVEKDGTVTIKGLPLQPGDHVEVFVSTAKRGRNGSARYPLRGLGIRYLDPFGSVAEDDWDAPR